MTHRLLTVALLTALWLVTLVSVAPLDVLLGVLVGAAVLLGVSRKEPTLPDAATVPLGRRLLAFPRFALATLREMLVGTWDVALRVVHLRPVERPGIVLVPIGERTPTGLAASALADTLSPGEVLVDVDHERRVMLVHVIDATDPDAIRAKHEEFYRRHQRGAFP
jgi:multisubunit Na+/H+ antiporter MnhE subunit